MVRKWYAKIPDVARLDATTPDDNNAFISLFILILLVSIVSIAIQENPALNRLIT